MSDVITGIIPSAPRRFFGSGVLYALGGLLIYIAIVEPPQELVYIALLIALGGLSIWGGYKMWLVTGRMIELTEQELRLSDGTVIAKVEDIDKVDRSFFAFKPSNGFLITLNTRYPSIWAPGLWWRFGKRVGIGGVLPASSTKIMSDTLSAMLAVRDSDDPHGLLK